MTRKRAIEVLEYIRHTGNGESEYTNCSQSVAIDMAIKALEQEPKCIWIKYDYRTICPKECGGKNPYWRIPENMENLKYCPYCGRKIEVEE